MTLDAIQRILDSARLRELDVLGVTENLWGNDHTILSDELQAAYAELEKVRQSWQTK